jgi:hypothetical protein
MESEEKWADGLPTWPTEEKYAQYHEIYLTPHEIAGYRESAQRVLQDFSNNVVARENTRMLTEAVQKYRTAAAQGHSKFRGWGVVEAILGALIWTLILILIGVILRYSGIDLFEVYQKVGGPRH